MTDAQTRRSFKLVEFGGPLQEVTEAPPQPEGSQVLLKVRACGVCHSDIHIADGYFDLGHGQKMDLGRGIKLPRVLGHEVVGEVVAAGPEAEGVAPGDRRIVFPWGGCGQCLLCRQGNEHICARPRSHGTTLDGGFSTYLLADHPRYLVAYDPLPDAFAATLACSGLTAFGAIRKAAPVDADHPLLIIGAGGLGLAAVGLARAVYGVGPVVAEIDPAKRQAALDAGASEAVDPNEEGIRKRLLQAKEGFASAIDFVGAQSTAELGMALLRKGGKLIVVGLFGGAIEVPVPTLPLRAIALNGSYVGSLEELRELVDLARAGHIQPVPLETRPLDAAQATLDDLRAGRIRGRAVLTP
ncbi:alcohol dehydrogenase [Marinibaculum pumilum]|uniref:alcohol dehydrogenase n=1 Tax=Marinibaculum pumilum TaxID=1766165 RepID=A0ABV7KWT4_9PROT